MLSYKDYTASIEFDEVDKVFTGRILGVKTIIGFHGETAKELETNFHQSIDHYLMVCEKLGKKAEKPCSGKFVIRMTPSQHAQIAFKSKELGKSLNAFVVETMLERV